MSKVLYIKADGKSDSQSRTYRISESFIEEYKKNNPNDEITTLDLYKEDIDFLREDDLPDLFSSNPEEKRNHRILKYAYQFVESDKYVIASPFWNLSIPAILKAYIDYVSVTGITFKYTESGPVGLCHNKKCVHIVARGGVYGQGPSAAYEMGDRYLRTIFGFFGITDFTTIAAEGLDVIGTDVEAILQKTIDDAKQLAKNF